MTEADLMLRIATDAQTASGLRAMNIKRKYFPGSKRSQIDREERRIQGVRRKMLKEELEFQAKSISSLRNPEVAKRLAVILALPLEKMAQVITNICDFYRMDMATYHKNLARHAA